MKNPGVPLNLITDVPQTDLKPMLKLATVNQSLELSALIWKLQIFYPEQLIKTFAFLIRAQSRSHSKLLSQ